MGLRSVVSKRLGLLAAGAALVLGMLAATAPAEARSRSAWAAARVSAHVTTAVRGARAASNPRTNSPKPQRFHTERDLVPRYSASS